MPSSDSPAKRRISLEEICTSFVAGLLDDVNKGFDHFIGLAREHDADKNIPPTQTLPKEEFALALFTLELLALPNLFEKALVERIRDLSVRYLAHRLGKGEEEVRDVLSLYESVWIEDLDAGLNPITAVSETLYGRLGIADFKSEKFPKIKGRDPIIVTALATVLSTGVGRWKILADNFSIV